MNKDEYLKTIEGWKKVRSEIKNLYGVSRTRKVKTKLKVLKRREKEYSKLLENFNGIFIENKDKNFEVNTSEERIVKKKNRFFNVLKRRALAVATLIGTAVSIITSGISFSASAITKEDPSVDKYYSVTQMDTQEKSKESSNEKANEKNYIQKESNSRKEEKGIRISYMDFDTFVYNSKISLKKDSKVYTNIYDVYYNYNGLEPYYNNSSKRIVKGITIEYNGKLEYYNIENDNSYNQMHSLLNDGGKVVSIVTSIDGDNYEGAYNISDVDLIYVNEKHKNLNK